MQNNLRLQLIGALAEKNEEIQKVEIRYELLRKHISVSLFSEDGIAGINFQEVQQQFEDVEDTINDYKKLKYEIEKIKNELGEK